MRELAAQDLYRHCDPQSLPFETTDELEALTEVLGQPRAVAAVELGIGVEREGYNIFALGPPGTGKRFVVQRYLEREATRKPVPDDWAYVHNFDEEHRPRALRLPPGKGGAFRKRMASLIEELQAALTGAFETEAYQSRREAIDHELEERREKAFEQLGQEAQQRGLAVVRTPMGLIFAPLRDGKVVPPDKFEELPEEEKTRLEGEVEQLQQDLQKIFRQLPRWQRERQEQIRELNRETTRVAVEPLFEEVRSEYASIEAVARHLERVEEDVIQNARAFLGGDGPQAAEEGAAPPMLGDRSPFRRYQVNVVIDHAEAEGAPVELEDNPTFPNLVGRVEHISHMGTLLTDFTLIKPGALHRANGGFLVLEARRLLQQPFAWEGLKRALQGQHIKIESMGQALSLLSTVSLEPEPIPLGVKVVLVGEPLLYYLLTLHDPHFAELFKVEADFDDRLPADGENRLLYARLIGGLLAQEKLKPFDAGAVARTLEYSARQAGDVEELSLKSAQLLDLLREADYWCTADGGERVGAVHVQRALDTRQHLSDRVYQRVLQNIDRGTLLIASEGEAVGQVNGLAVVHMNRFAFGYPARLTARVRLGEGEVVNIEREVDLSGPIHDKGVLILGGFLGQRYAAEEPLSLAASIVFEQSYGGVEGDSASLAELCALLSAIGRLPLRQSLAVTGSINQHGRVQAIGGVNEKIEGFFDVCRQRGLSGEQGVLIPDSNVRHLMLRHDVVEAVEAGRFHVYAVADVDQGMELLAGLPAGQADPETGLYPEGSVNRAVADRLAELAERRAAFSRSKKKRGDGETAEKGADGDGGDGDGDGENGDGGGAARSTRRQP